MRNKCKNLCFRIRWTLGKHFLPPAGCGSIFSAKSCWNAWRSGSWLARGQMNMVDEAKLWSPIHSTFEALVVWPAVQRCHGEEFVPFCWPILTADLAVFSASHWFAENTLRYNGFTGIQKTVVDQTGSRLPNSDHDLFWCKFGFGKCFGAASCANHWAGHDGLLYKIHFSSQVMIWLRNVLLLHRIREDYTSKWQFFFFLISGQLMRHPRIELFHLSNLLRMPNNCRMVNTEFLNNFLCSFKRINFDDCSQFVIVNFWRPATMLIFEALVSFAKFREPPLHCMFISSSRAKCVVDVASCLCCFTAHFELE